MPRIVPVHWKKLECIFLRHGFEFARQIGSHRHYIKKGINRPLVIPAHPKPVAVFVIRNNIRTAGMDRNEYFRYLADC